MIRTCFSILVLAFAFIVGITRESPAQEIEPIGVESTGYDCALCYTTEPVEMGPFDWRGGYSFFAYDECEEGTWEYYCSWCDSYNAGNICYTENNDEYVWDVFYGSSQGEVTDWLYDVDAWACEMNLCELSRGGFEALVTKADISSLRSLTESPGGKVILNHERGLLQRLSCTGAVAMQFDISSGPLSELLQERK